VRRLLRSAQVTHETRQVYGFAGELLAEYAASAASTSPQKEYGYRNGQLLITADVTTGPPVPTFSDDFNDNSLDPAKWSVVAPNSPAVVSETGQRLQITLPANTAAYNGISSNSTFDLTGKSVQVEVAQTVSQAGWCENFIQVVLDANNYYLIDVGAGSLVFRSMVGGVNNQTVISYDPSAFPYWRIRHDQAANTINLETSSNGTTWTTRKTVTPGFSLTALRFYLYAGAWGTGNGSPGAAKYDNFQLVGTTPSTVVNLQWLVTDQLGTPRMVFDQTGALASVKRHDYLPFGEELSAGQGVRSTTLGYGAADGVRQKFTQKERDIETGLDYSIHRYYASTQGRFTSPDPYVIFFEMKRGRDAEEQVQMLYEYIGQPQNWSRYSYGLNNPLNHTDPTGMRPPNKYEQAALDRLDQMASQEGDTDLGNGLRAARATIASIIDGLGKGKSDVGVNVAVNAILNIGNSNFSEQGSVTIGSANGGITIAFGPGTSNKCNVFVAGAYADGAGLDFVKNGGSRRGYPLIGGLPPVADWLGDAKDRQHLTNLAIVTDGSLKPGDIVAWRANGGIGEGHSSIHIGGNVLVYAGGPPDGTPQARTLNFVNDNLTGFFGGHEPYVVRRYNGKP
jgi:RHS repeat-associated protein